MANQSTKTLALFELVLVLAIYGCGGGGGGGGGSVSAPSVPSAPVAISGINASIAAGAATDSASLGGTAYIGGTMIGGVAVDGSAQKFSIVKLAEWAINESAKLPPTPSTISGATLSHNDNCAGGGSYSSSYNDVNNSNSFNAGETLNITFNACKITATDTPISGGVSLSLLTFMPAGVAWSASMNMTFSNLAASPVSLTGTVFLSIYSNDGDTNFATLSGTSLDATTISGTTLTTSNFNFSYQYTNSTGAYSLTGNGTSASSALGGSVNFSTTTQLTGNFNNSPDNPSTGALLVTCANNSKLKVTPQSNVNVRYEVDANGDGTFESLSDTTWTAIQSY